MNRKFNLNTKSGLLCGVCAGLADYFGINVHFLRFLLVVGLIFNPGPFFIIYCCIALFS